LQALQDKAELEKNARRRASSAAAHIKHPAMYKSVLNVENKLSGRATSPYRSPNKSPSKNNTQNASFSPNSGTGGNNNNIFKSNGVSSTVGELELFHVDLSSPAKVIEMISFHSFVRVRRCVSCLFVVCIVFFSCMWGNAGFTYYGEYRILLHELQNAFIYGMFFYILQSQLLWETAAGYMDIEKDDEAGIAALKAFVFTMHR